MMMIGQNKIPVLAQLPGMFLLAMALCIVSTGQSVAQTVTRVNNGYLVQFEETIDLENSVSSLIVAAFPGDIDIVRSNGQEIRLQESIQLRADDADESQQNASFHESVLPFSKKNKMN